MFLGLGMAVLLALGASNAENAKKKSLVEVPETPRGKRLVVLDDGAADVQQIGTAPGVLTEVEFPEEFRGTPECGQWCDTEKQPDEGRALYRLQTEPYGRYLTVQPTERRPKSGGMVVTIIVHLEHRALTLELLPGERGQADTRVIFTYPSREPESEYLRAERAKLEALAAQQVEAGLADKFLLAFTAPHRCLDRTWRARNDDIVLEVQQLCYFGEDVVISFTIENRNRDPLKLASATATKGQDLRSSLPHDPVQFQQTVAGVVWMHVPDAVSLNGPFDLTVYEDGGRRRVVTATGLKF